MEREKTSAFWKVGAVVVGVGLAGVLIATAFAEEGSVQKDSPATVKTRADVEPAPVYTASVVEESAASNTSAKKPEPFVLAGCDAKAADTKPSKTDREQSAKVRAAAQKSLDFLTRETIAWQEQYNCMGCHVQGVTGEALSVGWANQYDIGESIHTVFKGNLTIDGGALTSTGHASVGGYLRLPSRTYTGAALARYDELVDDKYSDALLSDAADILEYQNADGSLQNVYDRGPVSMGDTNQTYQAILTWKQAYARSADDRWLTAVAEGEKHLQNVVDGWSSNPPADIQYVNYAVLGLLAAGVGSGEHYVVSLQEKLLEAQNTDGGWGYSLTAHDASTPLATGQTLYTLRMLGLNDNEKVVEDGIEWLMKKQLDDGGWSDSGAGKAEAMWAVLGMVATDVLSINVAGVHRGQHVGTGLAITANAEDNGGSGVSKVEVVLDDITVFGECGDKTTYSLLPEGLSPGPHILDIVATNHEGKVASRQFTVYAGDTYLTQLGSKFEEDGTVFTLRDIAPTDFDHTIELTVQKSDEMTDQPTGEVLYKKSMDGSQGALSFFWDGKSSKGEALDRGDYHATLTVVDGKGKARQVQTLPFVHDTFEAQEANYGQVAGSLQFDANNADAANAIVELVDEQGQVVQQVRSTGSGSFRFRNVKASAAKGEQRKYKVRVKKDGFDAPEMDVAPAMGAESQLDMKLY